MHKLSDFNLQKCLYMSAGSHAGETIEEIIARKKKEIEKCGWSLWAFSSPIAKAIQELCCQEDELNVVMPVTGVATKGTPVVAKTYYDFIDEGEKIIPEELYVTFSGSNGYALVVENYYLIDESDNKFYKGNYDRLKYFNGVELLYKSSDECKSNIKNIRIVAKLKKPFIVSIK